MTKPSVKTFTSKEGDMIDCVEINKQLTLDHRLLKNQKVQMEPNLHVTSLHKTSPNAKSVRFGLRELCPIGGLPICRVIKEDLVSVTSLPKIPSVVSLIDNMVQNIKYGGGGCVTVYNMTVAHDQMTAYNKWNEFGPPKHISMIAAGWMVSTGDTLSQLFTYWMGEEVTPGFLLRPCSTYGGSQCELIIDIEQDRNTGNWWLVVLRPSIKVGYWPKELFPFFDGICPPMGSGHKPDDTFKRAAIFRRLHWVQWDGKFLSPSDNTTE
ncbi:hypothetical protein ACJRO7_014237 [Eucalyptus globulus]|uniref:Neprosin PEP catalytic domain-containing protein n=1 Tax=Eucalyptus globulus TaxID=34317 RepID=A0ABD3L094_EUCGL